MATAGTYLAKKTDYVTWIGYPLETITGPDLPSKRKVLQNLFYYIRIKKKDLSESLTCTYNNILICWENSELSISLKRNVITKIKKLYDEYYSMKRHWIRKNKRERLKQKCFSYKIDRLFDIEQERVNNRKRKGKDIRAKRYSKYRQMEQQIEFKTNEDDDDDDEDEGEDEDEDDDADDDYIMQPPISKRKRILSTKVCSVLDRTNTSVRKGTMIMASVVNEAGASTSSTVLSKSTVHRRRQKQREKTATAIKKILCSFYMHCPLGW